MSAKVAPSELSSIEYCEALRELLKSGEQIIEITETSDHYDVTAKANGAARSLGKLPMMIRSSTITEGLLLRPRDHGHAQNWFFNRGEILIVSEMRSLSEELHEAFIETVLAGTNTVILIP